MLCKLLNDVLHVPVIRSLLPTPTAYHHDAPLALGTHQFPNVRIPWAQLLFAERDLPSVWRRRLGDALRAGAASSPTRRRRDLEDASTVMGLWNPNGMATRTFFATAARAGFVVDGAHVRTPLGFLGGLTGFTRLREYVVTGVTAVLGKRWETDA